MSKTSTPILREYARVPEVLELKTADFIAAFKEYHSEMVRLQKQPLTAGDFLRAMHIEIV